jgi:hypothetical protein
VGRPDDNLSVIRYSREGRRTMLQLTRTTSCREKDVDAPRRRRRRRWRGGVSLRGHDGGVVSIVIGCSFSFEAPLLAAGIPFATSCAHEWADDAGRAVPRAAGRVDARRHPGGADHVPASGRARCTVCISPPFAITHAPSRMLVTDLKSAQLAAI